MEYKKGYNRKLVGAFYDFRIDEFMPNEMAIENQMQEVIQMMYQDRNGNLRHPEEVEALSPHEIAEMGFHVFDESICAFA